MTIGDFEVEVSSARIGGGWQAIGILPNGHQLTSGPAKSKEEAEHDIKQQATAHLLPQRRYDVNRPFESIQDDDDFDFDWKDVVKATPWEDKALEISKLTSEQLRNLWWNAAAHVYNWPEFCRHIAKRTLDVNEFIEAGIPLDHQVDFSKRKQESMSTINENEDKWIGGAINKKHEGYCTPMSKKTCTPRRKALARRFKRGDLHQEGRAYPELSEAEEAVVLHQADTLLEAPGHCTVCGSLAHRTANCPLGSLSARKPKALVPGKAAFYPSDGGGAGGGGGITST